MVTIATSGRNFTMVWQWLFSLTGMDYWTGLMECHQNTNKPQWWGHRSKNV